MDSNINKMYINIDISVFVFIQYVCICRYSENTYTNTKNMARVNTSNKIIIKQLLKYSLQKP